MQFYSLRGYQSSPVKFCTKYQSSEDLHRSAFVVPFCGSVAASYPSRYLASGVANLLLSYFTEADK